MQPLRFLVLVALATIPAVQGKAQTVEPPAQSRIAWSWTPFLGYAQNSPVGDSWGVTPDWRHVFLGIEAETAVLRVGPRLQLSYAPVLVPLLVLSHHPSEGQPSRKAIFAVGLAPFGLKGSLRASHHIQVFGTSAVGGLWSTRPIPEPDARAFNVTLEWGGGLDVAVGRGHAVRLGYKFHHLSNAYTAARNPGLDGHVLFAGWRSMISIRD